MITVLGESQSIETLRKTKLETPDDASERWKGIQHGRLVDTLQDEITSRGWEVKNSKFVLSKDKADMAGAFVLSVPTLESIEGLDYSLGFLTSNARRRAFRIVVGAQINICTNGMATGDIVLNKKHTKNLNLFTEIESAIDQYEIKASQISTIVAKLKETELDDAEANSILMEAGRQRLLTWTKIGRVDAEFREPSFDHGTGTSWALLNAFTQIVKTANPIHQMRKMNEFRQLLPSMNA